MSKPKLTVHEAIRKAIAHRWQTAEEVGRVVYRELGRYISGSACTARIRDLRKVAFGRHQVECRFLMRQNGTRVYEYRLQ